MPWYNDLRPITDENKQKYALLFPEMTNEEKSRTISNILKLQKSLANIPKKIADENLLICSWNLKDFGEYKNRVPESYFYLAEIMNKFDIISIQECRADLEPIKILLRLLGSHWTYLFNDVSDHTGSNSERSLVIYNTKRCSFSGQAGEIILHDKIGVHHSLKQFNRIPYLTGFTAGWKKFSLITLHLEPGKSGDSKDIRTAEVRFLLEALSKRLRKNSSVRLWSDNVIILGDMNLYNSDNECFELFNKNHFNEANDLIGKDTTTAKSDNMYDHIFFYGKSEYPSLLKTNSAGVVNMFDVIFTDEQFNLPEYKAYIDKDEQERGKPYKDKKNQYKTHWRTRQISDHYPIWIEMKIDSSKDFLLNKLEAFNND